MSSTKSITELPFGLAGRIFRSPMPYSAFDPQQNAFTEMLESNVRLVVILAEEHEYLKESGRDLKTMYLDKGLDILHLPILDFSVPHRADLDTLVDEIIEQALQGKNIAIHCLAGIGRTGLVMAALAQRVSGMAGKEAILWVRKFIPNALESPAQIRFLLREEKKTSA